MIKPLLMMLAVFALIGCTAEGNSYSLGAGQTTRFVSQAACEKEAQSTHADGTSRYVGYECRELLFDHWTIEVVRYENGALSEPVSGQ